MFCLKIKLAREILLNHNVFVNTKKWKRYGTIRVFSIAAIKSKADKTTLILIIPKKLTWIARYSCSIDAVSSCKGFSTSKDSIAKNISGGSENINATVMKSSLSFIIPIKELIVLRVLVCFLCFEFAPEYNKI